MLLLQSILFISVLHCGLLLSVSATEIITANGQLPLPAVRVRVTQKGLDYGAKLAIDAMMKTINQTEVPSMEVVSGGSKMILSNVSIVEFPRPQFRVILVQGRRSSPGSLKAMVSDLHPVVDAVVKISYSMGFFTTERELVITSTARNLSMMLQASVGIDDEGRPLPSNFRCNVTGDFDFTLKGEYSKWSGFFNMVYNMMRNKIRETVFNEVCSNVLLEINKTMITHLASVPMQAIIDTDTIFDYRLTKAPEITNRFLETSHRGVFLLPDLIEPPFVQSSIPAFPRHNDRMAYVYVTDYLANSGWYAALRNNKLQFSIDENSTLLPPPARIFLSTSCPGHVCLGTTFPQLSYMYPNSVAGINWSALNTSQPVFRFNGRLVAARIEGVLEIYMQRQRSRDHIFTFNTLLVGNVELSVASNKLMFNISNFRIDSNIRSSSLGGILALTGLLFDSTVKLVSPFVILPTLQGLGLQGFPLVVPAVPELKFINSMIVNQNMQGVFAVGTDVEYTVPDFI